MSMNVLQRQSIKTRVTLFTLAIFLISTWTLELYTSRMLHNDMQRQLSEQQFSVASLIAEDTNQELTHRLTVLKEVAGRITPAMLGNPAALQSFLEERLILKVTFSGDAIVLDPDGTVIAELPRSVGRVGVNYMDRDHVVGALKEGKSTIGRPVMGKKLLAPIIAMAAPIRDAQGKVIGALATAINLAKPNFLDKITGHSYSKTGGYLLVARQHRVIVTATDKSRIMEKLPAPGISPWIDHVTMGYEGSGVFVNPRGVEVLTSVKSVPVADWFVVIALPTEEAFAPIRAMQHRVLLATAFLTMLAAGLTWWILRRQLSPMFSTLRTLATLAETNQHPQPLPVTSQDEIGELVGGFNRLLGTLAQREVALSESEFRWKFALEGAGDGVWDWNIQSGKTLFSKRWKEMIGYAEDEFENRHEIWEQHVHPDDKDRVLAALQDYFDGKAAIYNVEFRLRCKDGRYKWILARGMLVSRSEDGQPLRMIGTHEDITERKQAEEDLIKSKNRYQGILHNMMDAYWRVDKDGRIVEANQAISQMHGYSIEELLQMSVSDFEVIESADDTRKRIETIKREGHDLFESKHRCRDGRIIDVEISLNVSLDEPGNIDAFHRDITQRKQAEKSMQLASLVYQNSSEAMMVTDADGDIITINPAFTEQTGYTEQEAIGQNTRILNSGHHDQKFFQDMWYAINTNGHWQGEIWNRRKNGEIFVEWLTINAIRDTDGSVQRWVALFSDITEKKESDELIWQQANFDPLTGLPNRRMFHDRLEQEIKKSHRAELPLALLFLDLDRFKEVNDTLGHGMGDLLLQEAAQRISGCVRETDTVARLGGDEFTLILGELDDPGSIERVSQNILGRLSEPFLLEKEVVYVSASIGITLYPSDAEDIDTLLKHADQAMYAAKQQGRNRFSYFTASMQEAAESRMILASDLRHALEAGQFKVYYQPIIDLDTGLIHKAEALLRWKHPKHGFINPAEFIPIAEDTGLIVDIGNWVFEEAARQVKHLRKH